MRSGNARNVKPTPPSQDGKGERIERAVLAQCAQWNRQRYRPKEEKRECSVHARR
jgi:hypothetical protein